MPLVNVQDEKVVFVAMRNFEKQIERQGAKLWMKCAGPADAPAVLYVHGGPGYTSYNFENSIGPSLEENLRMIYFDQRDCGRSIEVAEAVEFDIPSLVADIEAVREAAGAEQIGLIGHSFGGLLSLEYQRRFPARVAGILLVESIPDLAATIEHQTNYILSLAGQDFSSYGDDLRAIAEQKLKPLKKLQALHATVNWMEMQKKMFWRHSDSLYRNMALDIGSRLFDRHESRLLPALLASGYLESSHEELQTPLSVPGQIFAGRFSQGIGEENLRQAAERLRVPLIWFEDSGHLPYIEEPGEFMRRVQRFFLPA